MSSGVDVGGGSVGGGVTVGGGVRVRDGDGVGDGVVVGVDVDVGVGVLVTVGVGVAEGVEDGVDVGLGVSVGLGVGVGVAVDVALGVGLEVAAGAAMTGSSSGEYDITTRDMPRTKAMMDPMVARGSKRRQPARAPSCDVSAGEDADETEDAGAAGGIAVVGSCDDSFEAAHSRAASTRSSLGATSWARATYAMLALGSSLSHAIQSRAARLEGSRRSTLRKARRASAFSPDRAASSPLLSSALAFVSMGTGLHHGVATHHPTLTALWPIRAFLDGRPLGPEVPHWTGGRLRRRRRQCSIVQAPCQPWARGTA